VPVDSRVGTTFGKYTITDVLGRGGMGEVYEARDNEIGRNVALKIIKSQFADDRGYRMRFERESHAVAKLQEPHVIPIHGFGEIDGCLFIDMRLVRGTDLLSLIEAQPLEPERAVNVIVQIAAALDAAHAEGVIHRDVKPQNVIVTPADFAYLVDFGIAEVVGDTRITMAGHQIGSWAYMAPERFGNQKLTPAVDVYALTCVLHEALTGQTPFPGLSQDQVIVAHLHSPPPRPSQINPSVSAAFDDVIARGMAKEPDDRYGSASALGRAATRALKGDARTSLPRTELPPTQFASPPRYAAPPPYAPPPPPPQQPSWPPIPRADPQAFPPSGPQPVVSAEQPAKGSPKWLMPSVVVVAAALILAAVGVIVGLVAKLSSSSNQTAAPVTPMTYPSSTTAYQYPQSSSEPPLPTAGTPPPLVAGPDSTGASCDQGFQVTNQTGFATHSGRGSAQTSCFFANSVLLAYWNTFHNASTGSRTVSAAGAVPCTSIAGASCDAQNPANFLMQCAQEGSNAWLKCTGGKDAVVYLW
jgi:serine/threonine protein kinase